MLQERSYVNYVWQKMRQELPTRDVATNYMEVGNETMVMMYLNILKYAKHHCTDNEDPYEITDRVFTDALVANNKNN